MRGHRHARPRASPEPHPTPSDDARLERVRFDEIHDAPPARRPLALQEMRDRHGRRLEELGGRVGFARGDALGALESMRSSEVAVEAIDVVQLTGDRPDFTLQRWRCDRGIGETAAHYGRRSLKLARDFLVAYQDAGDGI